MTMASCGIPSLLRVTFVVLFIGLLSVPGEALERKQLERATNARFLPRSNDHKGQANYIETSATNSDPILAPPSQPEHTPLEPDNGEVEVELDLDQSRATKIPFMMNQVVTIWKFVMMLCCVLAVAAVVLTLIDYFNLSVMTEFRAASAQFVLALLLLLICPASRAMAASSYRRKATLFLLRSLIEMWLLILTYCALPKMSLQFLHRCCLEGDKLSQAEIGFERRAASKHKLDPEIREALAVRNKVSPLTTEWNLLEHTETLSKLKTRMAILLSIRPVIYAARGISSWFVTESWQVSAAFSGISLVLLVAAASLGIYTMRPIRLKIFRAIGCWPVIGPLQMIASMLFIVAQVQDLLFMLHYGSENIGQVFAGLFFLGEIVAALGIAYKWLTSAPLVNLVEKSQDYTKAIEEFSILQRIKLLFMPYPVTGGKDLDPAVALKRRSIPDPVTPLHVQEHADQQKRNVWRGVFTDMFADKVRSKALTVIVISLSMTEAVFQYNGFVGRSQHVAAHYFPGHEHHWMPPIRIFMGLLFAWGCWLICGVLLVGNSVYYSKWWLLIPLAQGCYMAVSNYIYFFTGDAPAPNAYRVGYFWSKFFEASVSMAGIFEILRVFCSEEDAGDFYISERASKEYTSTLLEKSSEGKRLVVQAKSFRKIISSTPPLLLVGAVSTIPVVLSFALVMLSSGVEMIRWARIGQVYTQAFSHLPSQEELSQSFRVLDRDYNRAISPKEAGLVTVMTLLGPYAQQIMPAMYTLWGSVSGEGDGLQNLSVATFVTPHQKEQAREQLLEAGLQRSLDQKQFESFLDVMYRTMAITRSFMQGDFEITAQGCFEALDTNHDGVLDKREVPIANFALGLQSVAPQFGHLIAPKLEKIWKGVDTDHDGNLNIQEFLRFDLAVKKEIVDMEQTVSNLLWRMVLGGATFNFTDPSSTLVQLHSVSAAAIPEPTWEVEPLAWSPAPVSAAAPAPASAAAPAPGPAFESAVSRVARRRSLREIFAERVKFMGEILIESTANLGEALSVLLVAADSILPMHMQRIQKMLEDVTGKRCSSQLLQFSKPDEDEVGAGVLGSNSYSRLVNEVSSWSEADIQKLHDVLWRFVTLVAPWISVEVARAAALLTAIAEGAGTDETEKADTALTNAFNVLDNNPKDGELDPDELGVYSALALVNPDLASHGRDIFALAQTASSLTGSTKKLDQDTFGFVLKSLTQIVAGYVNDVTGDGKADEADVRYMASVTVNKLNELGGASTTSFLQTWKPMLLRKAVRPKTSLLQTVTSKEIEDSWILPMMPETSANLIQFWITLNIDRIEAALYTAALLSFAFGIYVVAAPFFAYVPMYEKMQAGDKTYKGASLREDLKGRLDWATAYPGTLFSTTMAGAIILFFVIFIVLTVLSIPAIYMPIIKAFWICLFWLSAGAGFLFFLKRVVMDMVCMSDGEVVYPRTFSCIYVIFIVTNFAVGALLTVIRFVFMIPNLYVKYHNLSQCMLGDAYVDWDGGYSAFICMVIHDHDVSNPIRQGFLQAIAPQAHRLYGKKPLEEPRPQTVRQRTRNRLWTAYMTSVHPQIRPLRKAALAAQSAKDDAGVAP